MFNLGTSEQVHGEQILFSTREQLSDSVPSMSQKRKEDYSSTHKRNQTCAPLPPSLSNPSNEFRCVDPIYPSRGTFRLEITDVRIRDRITLS